MTLHDEGVFKSISECSVVDFKNILVKSVYEGRVRCLYFI